MANQLVYFHDVYDQLAVLVPDQVAVISAGSDRQCLTYDAIRERSLLLAAGLNRCLMSQTATTVVGELRTVALHLPRTHPDFVPLMVASSRLGVSFFFAKH